MENQSLYNKLKEYSQSDYYPFHMPGHKRNIEDPYFKSPFQIDITEIEGFDDLHHAKGIIKDCEEQAAKLYSSEETHFLINGSTVGILSAISGCTNKGDKIIMARNCHKSAYHGVFLNELDVQYVYPQTESTYGINGGLLPDEIEKLLIKEKDIKAVFITSPTYDGIVSDVKKISNIAHKYHIPLIVDEAHGAHFGFHPSFPKSSVELGADVVIHSLHKTLPSLTQTALIHMNGNLIKREKIRKYLKIYQTSSPSYILMASIDQCINKLERFGEELFSFYIDKLETLRRSLNNLNNIKLINKDIIGSSNIYDLDISKLVLSVKDLNIDGYALYKHLLKDYHLQMEMALGTYVLGMTSIQDTEEGFLRLAAALKDIENNEIVFSEKCRSNKDHLNISDELIKNNKVFTIYEAERQENRTIPLEESIGKISAEYIYVYPPGIPLLVPGEVVSEELIDRIKYYKNSGLTIEGMEDKESKFIKCCI